MEFTPGAYGWYPVTQFGRPDPGQLENALERIDVFIGELLEVHPLDPQKPFLMGFSQGSMISMSFLLTQPNNIASVISQSGYVPAQFELEIDETGVNGKPVVMTHDLEDASMPSEWSHQSRDFLLNYGLEVEYHNFHMCHTNNAESLAAMRKWMERQQGKIAQNSS